MDLLKIRLKIFTKSIKLLVSFSLVLFSTVSSADGVKDWGDLRDESKCDNGGGFFLWDSHRCLFDTAAINIDGNWVAVERRVTKTIRKKNVLHDSIGDRYLESYEGKNIRVFIEVEYLPASCDYAEEQCTYRNMRARIRIDRPGKPARQQYAVGYSGS